MGLISRVSSRTYRTKKSQNMSSKIEKPSLLSLALTKQARDYEWDSETFLDIVYYHHHILAIIFGLTWGFLGLTGAGAMVSYLTISAIIVSQYVGTFQDQDFEDFGGLIAVLKDGFMNRFATFLVCWILVYSNLHGSQYNLYFLHEIQLLITSTVIFRPV